jgi:4-hydroxy-2-oxoheptanedioate aldolase
VSCTHASPTIAEVIARQGVDFVMVDYQHGYADNTVGVQMFQAVAAGGAIPIARAAWNDPARIMAVLDAGASAVVVPMVDDAAAAAAAVRACRYPPAGARSFGPIRAKDVHGSAEPAVLGTAGCLVMIETESGVANLDEIAVTPGVDGLYVGPNDLALGLGLHPAKGLEDPTLLAVLDDVVATAHRNGIVAAVQVPSGQSGRAMSERGFDMVTIGSDGPWLATAVRQNLAAAKSEAAEAATSNIY